MKLLLNREYWPNGTNGLLSQEGKPLAKTIELPWRNNREEESCIPEGTYLLERRHSEQWGWHLEVVGVKGRTRILFHPANDALKELLGSIAPVTVHTGEGRGSFSRNATYIFRDYVFAKMEEGEEVWLEVFSETEKVLNLSMESTVWTDSFF